MIDPREIYDAEVSSVILHGQVGGRQYEATIQVRDLDQLAEVADRKPGRTAQQGPVRVQVLSPASVGNVR